MHPETGQKFGIPTFYVHVEKSTIEETFQASLNDPVGLRHANHYVFPIQYVEYLSSLWMSFEEQSHSLSLLGLPFRPFRVETL
jgi:hypothetical protein